MPSMDEKQIDILKNVILLKLLRLSIPQHTVR